MLPPPIWQDNVIMKKLLLICNTETPLKKLRRNLSAERSTALGLPFPNFHMHELENKILNFYVYPYSKPLFYVRYVDDIYLTVENFIALDNIKRAVRKTFDRC